MPTVDTVRVIVPPPQIVRITITTTPVPVVVSVVGFRSASSSITPLPTRPTTLNEVIAGGVTLGLWP